MFLLTQSEILFIELHFPQNQILLAEPDWHVKLRQYFVWKTCPDRSEYLKAIKPEMTCWNQLIPAWGHTHTKKNPQISP